MWHAIVLFALCLGTTFAIKPPKTSAEFVVDKDEFHYAHVCSMVQFKDQTMVTVFHAGQQGEGQHDTTVFFSVRGPGLMNWTAPVPVVPNSGVCMMNPNSYIGVNPDTGDERLFVNFHSGGSVEDPDKCSTHRWNGYLTYSDDKGASWAEPKQLPKDILGSVKNNCIKMSNGAVLCPSSTESVADHVIGFWMSHFETTDDSFLHWNKSSSITFNFNSYTGKLGMGVIQPLVFEVEPGKIVAIMRSDSGSLATATSHDYGRTWPMVADALHVDNPDSGIGGVSFLPDNEDLGLMMVYNPNPQGRMPLRLGHSTDGGKTWEKIVDLEPDMTVKYEYPYMIRDRFDSSKAHVCYTYSHEDPNNRFRTIKHMELDF
eukprot:TRINITY_DN2414_c0_g1_i2.p1 TRINITY_DN2414_c0_g1~~TRINITY_DN2414_c0_g1_i2.p1  ORF type:complete len:372 (-),score=50.69 TRINITY_DN2414_c0_g1_i2:29-1144(-)